MEKIKEIRKYRFPNAIVTVRIPDLTPEEYEKRHRILEQATIEILKDQQDAARREKEKNKKTTLQEKENEDL